MEFTKKKKKKHVRTHTVAATKKMYSTGSLLGFSMGPARKRQESLITSKTGDMNSLRTSRRGHLSHSEAWGGMFPRHSHDIRAGFPNFTTHGARTELRVPNKGRRLSAYGREARSCPIQSKQPSVPTQSLSMGEDKRQNYQAQPIKQHNVLKKGERQRGGKE